MEAPIFDALGPLEEPLEGPLEEEDFGELANVLWHGLSMAFDFAQTLATVGPARKEQLFRMDFCLTKRGKVLCLPCRKVRTKRLAT